ncbi:hypothetical protein [Kineothrix sp. MB12-C1]|uniref:hypothetical protein n=1 Tax=Kineothrix sp. MB12-C1 TaxID=3070215 RepID=UPI0027D32024|nr:hypothetical protein [Kineothrix sp. MB12-C1]WMC94048.1 hypothetical protein RBB56_07245 [Kineothrix sp. MB12-C1]
MIISSSSVGMESARNYSSYMSGKTSVIRLVGEATGVGGGVLLGGAFGKGVQGEGREQTAQERKKELQNKLQEMSSNSKVKRPSHLQNKRDALSTVRETCMQYLIKLFFGETKRWDYNEMFTGIRNMQGASSGPVTEVLYYQREIYYREEESTSFSAEGTVICADGRELRFQMDIGMSRSFSAYYEENYVQIQTRMCDPLVINLEGNMAQMEDQTFFFDIDGDGVLDEISKLNKKSGYLAFDKNGDGIINDGNELFGAKSGNGFQDLAAYDSDGNGWIDEADDIWEKLCIWVKDENGDKCYKLSEKKIGAICLSNISTDFSLNNERNAVNGMIRRTGLFLYENGGAGSIQHLDVAHKDAHLDASC